MERRRRRFPFSHPSRTNQFRDAVSVVVPSCSLDGFEIIFKIILSLLFSFLPNQKRILRKLHARPFKLIRISPIIILMRSQLSESRE